MVSVFTRIIDGELPGHFIWSDDECVAFLSINPISNGHALVIPRREVDHWLDLDISEVSHLMAVSHHIGKAISKVFSPVRVGQMIAGFEVPHCHIHVLGLNDLSDMSFAKAASNVDHAELAGFAKQLREALAEQGFASNAKGPND